MESALTSPAAASLFGIPTVIFSILIPVVGTALFAYIIIRRLTPLVKAAPDDRFCCIGQRIGLILKLWLAQWRHPRYMLAGVLHIFIFAGFIILGRTLNPAGHTGFFRKFCVARIQRRFRADLQHLKRLRGHLDFLACVITAIRRGIIKPERYAVPPRYGKDHTAEAIFVLGLISTLMISESLFEASRVAAQVRNGVHAEFPAALSLAWFFSHMLSGSSLALLQNTHLITYFIHDLTFFFFLCFLPLGKHFHVITSIFNVFFMRVEKGNVKPVRYGVSDEQLDDLDSFGVKVFEDFTWKHILDFYTCADCGRCSDHCPANAVGRPLSPRFISIKGRDYAFRHYPSDRQQRRRGQSIDR